MDIIIKSIAESPFSSFLFPIFILGFGVVAIAFYSLWRRRRIEGLIERIRAIHAQAGTRPQHLPSLPSSHHLFSESTNWTFKLDRELNALERQRGVRVPYSQRRLSFSFSEDVLNRLTRRVEALEGLQRQ